jgi:pSer/pThr/pTyr-binding forkhead associated (FHA) protein
VTLPHRSVSVRHATIEQRSGRYVVVDHGSTNGTRVNGVRLVPERPKPLRDGDQLDVGTFRLSWKEGVAVAQSPTAERTASVARRLLRGVLGDDAPPAARLVVSNGDQAGRHLAIPAPPARLVIGRAETCDLPLNDADASREHVELAVDLDGVVARDRGSKNGLVVNERRVPEKRLADRDEILVGSTVLVFEDASAAAVRDAEKGDDEPFVEPSPPPAPEPAAEDPDAPTGEPDPPPAAAPAPVAKPAPAKARFSPVEVAVYLLAAIVLALSIGGLALLFRAE